VLLSGSKDRVKRDRFTVAGIPKGPWRETRAAAIEDAVAAGEAEQDEHNHERFYWNVLADIEEQE
jgi:hypothetical protein